MKYILPLCIALFLAACGGSSSSTISKEEIYQLYDSGHYKEALDGVNKLIARHNDSADLYALRASIRSMTDQLEDSVLIDFQHAINLRPQDYYYYFQRAQYYATHNQKEASLPDFDKAIQYAHSDSIRRQMIWFRADAQVKSRKFEGALKDYKTLLDADSSDFEGIINIAALLMEMGRQQEAMVYLQRGNQLFPNNKTIIGNLGFWYLGAKQYDKAVAQFNKALELDEKDALAYNNRAYARLQLKDVEGALRDVDHSIELRPDNSYAYRNRALVYIAMKRKQDACADLVKAMDLGFNERYGTEVQELIVKNCPDD